LGWVRLGLYQSDLDVIKLTGPLPPHQYSNVYGQQFVARHQQMSPVVENEVAMRGSYAMVSPDGCFYDSTRKSWQVVARIAGLMVGNRNWMTRHL